MRRAGGKTLDLVGFVLESTHFTIHFKYLQVEFFQNRIAAGYNKAVRPVRGSVAELLEVLEVEDNGHHGWNDVPTIENVKAEGLERQA